MHSPLTSQFMRRGVCEAARMRMLSIQCYAPLRTCDTANCIRMPSTRLSTLSHGFSGKRAGERRTESPGRGDTHVLHVHAFTMPCALHAIHFHRRRLFHRIHAPLQLLYPRRLDLLRLFCIHDLVLDF
jgi:hypothetical protein